jgi:hypothetical protein
MAVATNDAVTDSTAVLPRPHLRGEPISPAFAPDLVIEVDAILGPVEATDAEDQPSRASEPLTADT